MQTNSFYMLWSETLFSNRKQGMQTNNFYKLWSETPFEALKRHIFGPTFI